MNAMVSRRECSSEDFYNQYASAFGQVVSATMEAGSYPNSFVLTLVNDKGESIIMNGGVASGNKSENSDSTIRVLRKAGFQIDDDFVYRYTSFNLEQ